MTDTEADTETINRFMMTLPLDDEQAEACAEAFIGELQRWGFREANGVLEVIRHGDEDSASEVHPFDDEWAGTLAYDKLSHRAAAKAFLDAYEAKS